MVLGSGRRRKMRAGSFNSKLGQIKKLKNSPEMPNYPASCLGCWIDAMGWCSMRFEIYGGGFAKDGRSGMDIFNLIVVKIKIAKLTT